MPSKPIPGSTGEVLTCLPSPYQPHPATGLLYLPRFLAKCAYVKAHGALPASYAKNYKRGLDRFLCMHLGIDPAAVEKIVQHIELEFVGVAFDRLQVCIHLTGLRDIGAFA